ncbi:MAG: hypothetical protein HQK63_17490 [Desulfamplus sp.]|nr:hypothetical protein [Desulfamplus sp.]
MDLIEEILNDKDFTFFPEELPNYKTAGLEVKFILGGFILICMHCKKIRDDKGYWHQLEQFITEHYEAKFSHGICPDCMKNFYSEFYEECV